MYAYELQPNQPYTLHGNIYRSLVTGGRPSVNVATGLGFYPGPLVEVEPVSAVVAERIEHCARCGEAKPVSALTRSEEKYYDWDDPDTDSQGSVLLSRTVWRCRDRDDCGRVRRDAARVAREVAESEDAAVREAGWGAIGNGARGG